MYILRQDFKSKHGSRCGGPYNTGLTYLNWDDGLPKRELSASFLPIRYSTDQKHPLDDYCSPPEDIFLCSEPFLAAIRDLIVPEEVETLEAEVLHSKSKTVYPMWIVNPLGSGSMIDVAGSVKSEAKTMYIPAFLSIQLKKEYRDSQRSIFRDENLSQEFFVSDGVAHALLESGLKGFQLLAVEQYYNQLYC